LFTFPKNEVCILHLTSTLLLVVQQRGVKVYSVYSLQLALRRIQKKETQHLGCEEDAGFLMRKKSQIKTSASHFGLAIKCDSSEVNL